MLICDTIYRNSKVRNAMSMRPQASENEHDPFCLVHVVQSTYWYELKGTLQAAHNSDRNRVPPYRRGVRANRIRAEHRFNKCMETSQLLSCLR